MTARLPSDLMDRWAQESARLLALNYLSQIDRARARLEHPLDTEALHDFRVGLRRLRSCIRAYREQLRGSVTEKMEQSLRKLMRATNAGRDAEVQLTWLRKQAGRLEAEDMQGLFWLIGRLEGRKYETLDPVTAQVGRQFEKVAVKFRRRLGTLQVDLESGPRKGHATFGQVTGQLVQQLAARLEDDLGQVHGSTNVKEAHRARVAVKRLRYLLDPVARRTSRARDLVSRLKVAQDRLGELHDMYVLSDEIALAIEALSSHPDRLSGFERGLGALERLTRAQAAVAFENFDALWGGGRASRFLSRTREIGSSLRPGPAKPAADGRTLTLGGTPSAEAVHEAEHQDAERVV